MSASSFVIPTAGLVLLPLIMHCGYGTYRDRGREPQLDLYGRRAPDRAPSRTVATAGIADADALPTCTTSPETF